MAQFQVPQFIEIEQKIIAGRMTLKQFILICIGMLVVFGLFFILGFVTWLILTTIVAAGILAFGFLKIGGRPFSAIVTAAFFYYWNPSFYLWRSEEEPGVEIPKIETKLHKTHGERKEIYAQPQLPREFGALPKREPAEIKVQKFIPSKEAREKLAVGRGVQDLWEKISTTRSALPKRERAINVFLKGQAKDKYEILRSAAGKMEVAKRVDFK